MPALFNPVQRVFNGKFWEVTREMFGHYGQGNVLDLACGTGELRKYINPNVYYGLDINPNFISFAKKRITGRNTNFIAGDMTTSIPNVNFDTAFLVSAAHHLSEDQLETVLKTLKVKKVRRVIIIDGVPFGVISRFLEWLDDVLGGGEFFKDESELANITKKFFKIESRGTYKAPYSLYRYPYVVGTL
ncbi:MAG: Methyltransferase domain family [Candidatus Daviesbacteria bacterium GW2011_GWA2_42_7]|nr:MAG: Methyltransferase domain family [Candidatus Daviesbacteria bacterium GW2011_GWA2_42_7]